MTIEQLNLYFNNFISQDPAGIILDRLFPEIDQLGLPEYERQALVCAVLSNYTNAASLKAHSVFQSRFEQIESSNVSAEHKFVYLQSLHQFTRILQIAVVATTTTSSVLGKRKEPGVEEEELIQFNPLITVAELSMYVRNSSLNSQLKLALLACIYATKSQFPVTSYGSCVPLLCNLNEVKSTDLPDPRLKSELIKCVESVQSVLKSSELDDDSYRLLISKMPHYQLIEKEDERYPLISRTNEFMLAFRPESEDRELKVRAANLILKPQLQIAVDTTLSGLKATYLRLDEAWLQNKKIEQVKQCYLRCFVGALTSIVVAVKKPKPTILNKEDEICKLRYIKDILDYRYSYQDIRIFDNKRKPNFIEWCVSKEASLAPEEHSFDELKQKTIPQLYYILHKQKGNRRQIKELIEILKTHSKPLSKEHFLEKFPSTEESLYLSCKDGPRKLFTELSQDKDLLTELDEKCKIELINSILETPLFVRIPDSNAKKIVKCFKLMRTASSKEDIDLVKSCTSIKFESKEHVSRETYEAESTGYLVDFHTNHKFKTGSVYEKLQEIKEFVAAHPELFA